MCDKGTKKIYNVAYKRRKKIMKGDFCLLYMLTMNYKNSIGHILRLNENGKENVANPASATFFMVFLQ